MHVFIQQKQYIYNKLEHLVWAYQHRIVIQDNGKLSCWHVSNKTVYGFVLWVST